MKNSLALLIFGCIILTTVFYSCKKEPDPPTVITATVLHISATSSFGGGDITNEGGAPVSARGVCWSISPNPTVSDAHTSDSIGTGSFSSLISGLTPETTY